MAARATNGDPSRAPSGRLGRQTTDDRHVLLDPAGVARHNPRMATVTKLAVIAALTGVANAQPTDDDALSPPSTVAAQPTDVQPTVAIPHVHKTSGLATTERWGGGVRVTGLSGIGALPGVNYGGEVAGLVRRDEAFVELGMSRWKPEHTYITPDNVELGLNVWTLRAGWASMRMPLRGWLLAEVGEVAGMKDMPGVVARMMMGDVPSNHAWRAAGAGFGVAWPMADTARLVGNVELAVPLASGGAMLDGGDVYKPDAVTARYSVGLEVGWR
jgi:hypothetical protein